MVPVVMSNGQMPALPQEYLNQYASVVEHMCEGMGATYNFLRPGKMDFTLVEGGTSRTVPNNVAGVLLAVSPYDFCTWYAKAYQPGQEPETPDLVWNWPDHNKFPDALPEQFRQKVAQNGKERWAFRVARRSVWVLLSNVNGQMMLDLERPYIFDMTSMSMYGKSDPKGNIYKYNGLMSLCQRLSTGGFPVSPMMFLTQIAIDGTVPVPGVVNFRPEVVNQNLAYLDSHTFNQVLQLALSAQVQDMLKVKEKLTWGTQTAQPVPPSSVTPAATVQATPAPSATMSASVQPVQSATQSAQPVKPVPQPATQSAQPVKPVPQPATQSAQPPMTPPTAQFAEVVQPVQPVTQPTQPLATPPVQPAANPTPQGVLDQAANLLAQMGNAGAQSGIASPQSTTTDQSAPALASASVSTPVTTGVNPATANAINNLDSIL